MLKSRIKSNEMRVTNYSEKERNGPECICSSQNIDKIKASLVLVTEVLSVPGKHLLRWDDELQHFPAYITRKYSKHFCKIYIIMFLLFQSSSKVYPVLWCSLVIKCYLQRNTK